MVFAYFTPFKQIIPWGGLVDALAQYAQQTINEGDYLFFYKGFNVLKDILYTLIFLIIIGLSPFRFYFSLLILNNKENFNFKFKDTPIDKTL